MKKIKKKGKKFWILIILIFILLIISFLPIKKICIVTNPDSCNYYNFWQIIFGKVKYLQFEVEGSVSKLTCEELTGFNQMTQIDEINYGCPEGTMGIKAKDSCKSCICCVLTK